MHGNNTLGRFSHFGRGTTYNPFANNADLKQVSNQHFYIPNQNTFAGNPTVCIATGLVTNILSFLNTNDFSAEVLDIDGTLLRSLNARVGVIGDNNYPKVDDILWFDVEGMQGDYWIHDEWKGKILKLNGKFEATAITAEEMNQLTGCVIGFGGSLASIPNRSLVCQGQAISRYYYSNLFAVIGSRYGEGDGATTFNLPDLRNGVVKGVDNILEKEQNATDIPVLLDPDNTKRIDKDGNVIGNVVGSYQKFAIENIVGTIANQIGSGSTLMAWLNDTASGPFATDKIGSGYYATSLNSSNMQRITQTFDASRVVSAGKSTRDNNVYMHHIIFI